MANLFVSIAAASSSLRAFERALEVTQNNVSNASTPGYARQRLILEAASFSVDGSLAGGVTPGALLSARDDYAEQEVWSRLDESGYFSPAADYARRHREQFRHQRQWRSVRSHERDLFQSFSAWSASPGSSAARSAVLDAAGQMARSFQQTAGDLSRISSQTDRQLQQTVTRINELAGVVRECNAERINSGCRGPGLGCQAPCRPGGTGGSRRLHRPAASATVPTRCCWAGSPRWSPAKRFMR